jgi:hypothetical protein
MLLSKYHPYLTANFISLLNDKQCGLFLRHFVQGLQAFWVPLSPVYRNAVWKGSSLRLDASSFYIVLIPEIKIKKICCKMAIVSELSLLTPTNAIWGLLIRNNCLSDKAHFAFFPNGSSLFLYRVWK